MSARKVLGINSLGRIGKLTLWHHAGRKYFDAIVVNQGREVGKDLEAFCHTIERDSTYGPMHYFLHGRGAKPCVRIENREKALLRVDGVPVTILRKERNPVNIPWREHGARIVVDCTGKFNDPTRTAGDPKGSLRGHLVGGAEKVMNSAAFKPKAHGTTNPDDAVVLIYGVNHEAFDPSKHHLVSAASCTTTGLAHMMKALLDAWSVDTILTASMSTIHAVTNSQSVLDNVPKAGAKDLRKTRSILNNIILTSTNAAAALEKVIPVVREIGFMADSVRVPTTTASLIILNLTLRSDLDEKGEPTINRETLNGLYEAAARAQKGLLVLSMSQNVSTDMIGEDAAVVIEGHETHTRTGFIHMNMETLPGITPEALAALPEKIIPVPVTHAKIFGWYDNEYGSYTNRLAELTLHVAERMYG